MRQRTEQADRVPRGGPQRSESTDDPNPEQDCYWDRKSPATLPPAGSSMPGRIKSGWRLACVEREAEPPVRFGGLPSYAPDSRDQAQVRRVFHRLARPQADAAVYGPMEVKIHAFQTPFVLLLSCLRRSVRRWTLTYRASRTADGCYFPSLAILLIHH